MAQSFRVKERRAFGKLLRVRVSTRKPHGPCSALIRGHLNILRVYPTIDGFFDEILFEVDGARALQGP